MIYYIYKITLTKGKLKSHYYIGQHKTDNIDDGYKGSGTLIRNYYKKYPNDYIKEIICYCDNADDLNEKEAFYVGDLYKTDDMCLNLRAGGDQPGFSDEARQNLSEAKKGKPSNRKGKTPSDETIQKMSEAKKGKLFSDEHKQNLSDAKKGIHWYNNGITEIQAFECPVGYVPGRLKGSPKGKRWYNNGTTQIRAFECPVGYVPGRLKFK